MRSRQTLDHGIGSQISITIMSIPESPINCIDFLFHFDHNTIIGSTFCPCAYSTCKIKGVPWCWWLGSHYCWIAFRLWYCIPSQFETCLVPSTVSTRPASHTSGGCSFVPISLDAMNMEGLIDPWWWSLRASAWTMNTCKIHIDACPFDLVKRASVKK